MIEYIFKKYEEETQEFSKNLNDNIEDIILEIKNENSKNSKPKYMFKKYVRILKNIKEEDNYKLSSFLFVL